MDRRKVLRHNPCTIAGTASLLADSEFLAKGDMPDGAGWWSDEKLIRHPVYDGWVFSLGWWRVPGEWKTKRFGVDVGRADKEP